MNTIQYFTHILHIGTLHNAHYTVLTVQDTLYTVHSTVPESTELLQPLEPFAASFRGFAWLGGKLKTQTWLGLGSERRVESELGSGLA